MVKYKQKCIKCKTKYVIVSRWQKFVTCYDCQKKELVGEVKDPKLKKMFDIPPDYYINNSFLRNIKISYLKWGNISEKQIEAFNKTVEKMKKEKSEIEFKLASVKKKK